MIMIHSRLWFRFRLDKYNEDRFQNGNETEYIVGAMLLHSSHYLDSVSWFNRWLFINLV